MATKYPQSRTRHPAFEVGVEDSPLDLSALLPEMRGTVHSQVDVLLSSW